MQHFFFCYGFSKKKLCISDEVVNDAINKNLGLFTQEIMPYVENALSAAILDIANKIVNPFTFEQLFPH